MSRCRFTLLTDDYIIIDYESLRLTRVHLLKKDKRTRLLIEY